MQSQTPDGNLAHCEDLPVDLALLLWKLQNPPGEMRSFMESSCPVPYRFKLGRFECLVLSDGVECIPWSQLFSNSPDRQQLEMSLHAHHSPSHELLLPITCLLIEVGEYRVLIDTGTGSHATAGHLPEQLGIAGIGLEQIDMVLLSHAHLRHIGGTSDREGRLRFANAHHILWREEWEFWKAAHDLGVPRLASMAPTIQEYLRLLEPRLVLIERSSELLSGIQMVAAPGHSAGHMALSVASEGQYLLCVADTVFHPLQLEYPHWFTLHDLRPEQALHSRLRLLDRAVAEQALVYAAHFPFPGLGRVVAEGKTWRWQPIILSESESPA